jgi:hypothetical protein
MEANSAGKHECRAKEDKSSAGHIWAAGFHHVMAYSRLAGVLKLMNHLFLFCCGGGRGEPRITETTHTESAYTEARLYLLNRGVCFTVHL